MNNLSEDLTEYLELADPSKTTRAHVIFFYPTNPKFFIRIEAI